MFSEEIWKDIMPGSVGFSEWVMVTSLLYTQGIYWLVVYTVRNTKGGVYENRRKVGFLIKKIPCLTYS